LSGRAALERGALDAAATLACFDPSPGLVVIPSNPPTHPPTCLPPSGHLPATLHPQKARRELEEAKRKGGEGADSAREYWMRIMPEAVQAFDAQVRSGDLARGLAGV
jgi:hypothetical protein